MRTVFLLLVLANLLFYAYAQLARQSGIERELPLLQIRPESIRVLRAAQAPRARAPACIEWGPFAGGDAARAEAALAELEAAGARLERRALAVPGYWVYIPPLRTRAEAERKAAELRALGVHEFVLLEEGTRWRNAISLGIFGAEEAAQAHLARLRERGVRSALAERRDDLLRQVRFYVREPDQTTVRRLAEIQREFPGSELKAGACPAHEP